MTVEIDLTPFCATESSDPFRPYLWQPFSRGTNSFATNGHIIVRISRRDDVPEADKIKGFPDSIPVIFEKYSRDELFPLVLPAEVSARPPAKVDCPQCDGRGTEHECPDCECECEACNGTGTELGKASCGIFGIPVDLKYLRMIARLPSPEIARPANSADPLYFRFDSGDGMLMPLRRTYAHHVDLPLAKASL